MIKIQLENPRKIKREQRKIKSKLKVELKIAGDLVEITGEEINEFIAEKVIKAVDFGFDTAEALLLKNEDFVLNFINIKDHTRRKNLEDIRGRIVGRSGKAKRTIEEITGSVLVLHDNTVGVIASSEHAEQTMQGIVSIIQGSKHGNVFSYLERQNTNLRKLDSEDLGLKHPEKDLKNLD